MNEKGTKDISDFPQSSWSNLVKIRGIDKAFCSFSLHHGLQRKDIRTHV